ncbi:hypothetical protein [Fodinicola feengrottensis]|uniref:hypothetical protein n=1 Tax=Fodinicola feengrottensis TaxID=435914 RepID=UPI0013D468D7|nr:hypothetical protein [Fodinicola feengrottensis]
MPTSEHLEADRQELPYRRRAGGGAFGAPAVLDVQDLRKRWLPWITMGVDDTTHVIVKTAWMTWNHTMTADRNDILARPWTSLLTSAGLRPFILGQCRAPNHLAPDAPETGEPISKLRAVWRDWLYGPDPLRRLQMTVLLGALTTHLPVLETPDPDPDDTDPIVQHLRYARAGVLHQRYPKDPWNDELSQFFTKNATEAVLRTGATVRVITQELRIHRAWEPAKPWIDFGYAGLDDLKEHPRWLAQLAESKFHRCVALYHFRKKDAAETANALRASYQADAELRKEAGDNPILHHLWLENHRTLLESTIKNQVGHDPAGVAAQIAELDEIEPYFYESRFFVGLLFARAEQPAEAARHFEAASRGGSGSVGCGRRIPGF